MLICSSWDLLKIDQDNLLLYSSYQPFNTERKDGEEEEDDPEDGTNYQPEPEDPRLRIWRVLFPGSLKKTGYSHSQDICEYHEDIWQWTSVFIKRSTVHQYGVRDQQSYDHYTTR